METLQGIIEHIVFRNQENGYTVLTLTTDMGEKTCVGLFRCADEGENILVEGEWTSHPVYGNQFNVSRYEVREPDTVEAIERYLGSGAIKGVGAKLAKRIVSEFGENTFRVLEEEPELLARIKGISNRMAREIGVQVVEKQGMRRILLALSEYGISNAMAAKIYRQYGMNTIATIRENPYKLAEDIDGIGFRTADEIAARAGIGVESEFRIRCGIIYSLRFSYSEGHIYLPKDLFLVRCRELLDISDDLIWLHTMNLAMDKKVVIKDIDGQTRIYDRYFYNMELSVARKLYDLNVDFGINAKATREVIKKLAVGNNIVLEDFQIEAVLKAAMHGVIVITGGPGTGKTTTINTLLSYCETEGLDVLLAAPTGRAAKRMTEATGYEASTIQRMLKLMPASDTITGRNSYSYEYNEENPLECDVVIIDEMSMVDLPLFQSLLRAICVGTRLVLVGDINQLPSVGPGSVLKDIIASGELNVVRLQKIFRQAENSDIVMNAHRILKGEMITLDNKSRDFFFLKRSEVNKILNNIITLVRDKLPGYVNAGPLDIQVLTPMRKGALGVENLNPILQRYLNPPSEGKTEKEYHDVTYRVGDKVMQIKNNYRLEWEIVGKYGVCLDKGLGVFNGDCGTIVEINNYLEYIKVEYEEKKTVMYPFSGLDELEMAYAVTIHKSQGSEYPAVVIPILTGPRLLFNRNLLYTAITRAKTCAILLGSEEMIADMIANTEEATRFTSLDERIKEIFESE